MIVVCHGFSFGFVLFFGADVKEFCALLGPGSLCSELDLFSGLDFLWMVCHLLS